MKKIILWRYYLVFYLILIILFNLILLNYPLTNVFGFEFSVLNSILLVILSGFYTMTVLLKVSENKTFLLLNLSSLSLFLILPLTISITHDLFTISCSIWEGLLFYTFITVPSVIIGSALGILAVFVSRKFRYLIFILIILAVLSITFFELYYNPQIYFYNPLYAYFPGTIYDEAISVDLKLMMYRFLNFIFFGSVYIISAYVFYRKSNITKKLVLIVTILISALFVYLSPELGLSTTQSRLKSVLSDLVRTEHFDIYFSPGISKTDVKIIALNHEYYYQQLERIYQTVPSGKYTSFIFKDDAQKKEYFGSENADVAKPWLKEIFTIADNYNTTLRHEIAHCFAGEFGWSIFRIAGDFNPALIEGAAVAGAPEYDLNSVHYMASLAYRNGYKVKLQNLFEGLNFFGQTSGLSYIYAGSFCKYLIDNYGITRFKRLYSDPDFKKVYGKNLAELSRDYFSFIAGEFEAKNSSEAEYYYGMKPIIYKTCPRYVAIRLKEAWGYYNEQNYDKALRLFKEILTLTNNYSALMGYANSLFSTGEESETISFLKERINNFKHTSYYYNIEFTLADFCSRVGDLTYARSLYNKIISENPNRTLFYLSNLREKLLETDSLIVPYLKGSDFDKYLIISAQNKNSYDYFSVPVLIDLAQSLGENYNSFLNLFKNTIIVDSYQSSFAVYRLSEYLLSNLDFSRGRKMAALSMRYDNDKNFNFILEENFNRSKWLYENGNKILSTINFK